MEHNEAKTQLDVKDSNSDILSEAVNSSILDYYKKIGRKRDLEKYFSLSTAQSEVKDRTSSFWKSLKMQSDSSDSEKSNDKPTELCRISIRCSAPDSSSSQDENKNFNDESNSPPIITDYVEPNEQQSDQEEHKSDNESQKSMDMTLDTSVNKPLSPTSSINSQRKLEWDSLADVGYANESDRKTSASSLSTIEKLALKQQYSNNDAKQDPMLEGPTAHSTPLDPNDSKGKKAFRKTSIYKKDIDQLAINVPMSSELNQSQAINVNLTKHISFNVERNGGITFDNARNNFVVEPNNSTKEATVTSHIMSDKQIQTSLKNTNSSNHKSIVDTNDKKVIPVMINLNTLKRRTRKRRVKMARKKIRNKKSVEKDNIKHAEKTGGQVSEAESFEYMPGHMYNQNFNNPKLINAVGNKSSLESSGGVTTDSSKGSKFSFSKDLEKSVALLKIVLRQRYNDTNHKNKLIKEVVGRLLKSKYRDDESTTDFLSGLSFYDKKTDSGDHHTTSSTSENNKTWDQTKYTRPRKSILRSEKNRLNPVASTSMSAPNLLSMSNSDKLVHSKLGNPLLMSKSESEQSDKENLSANNVKTSSEELYQKYIEALQKEQAYKNHIKEKELLLRQRVNRVTRDQEKLSNLENHNRLKDLIKDLTRNNYDDGSGDASKLEGGSNSNIDYEKHTDVKKIRSHSVFTLSSCNSEISNKKSNLKKRLQKEVKDSSTAGCSKNVTNNPHGCPFQSIPTKISMTDNSVQVNIKNNKDNDENYILTTPEDVHFNKEPFLHIAQAISKTVPGAVKYVCLCEEKSLPKDMPQKITLYKCCTNSKPIEVNTVSVQCDTNCTASLENKRDKSRKETDNINSKTINADSSDSDYIPLKRVSKSSQTKLNLALNMLQKNNDEKSTSSWSSEDKKFRALSMERHLSDSVVNLDSESVGDENQCISESTRWMQTEISINPKISNPSLSDINIIKKSDCARLVGKSIKQTKVKLSSASESCEKNIQQCICSDYFTEPTSAPKKSYCDKEDQQSHNIRSKSYKTLNNDDANRNIEEKTENFIIPIKGTNMTLMVKLGQKSIDNSNLCNEKVKEANNDDHSKGVQSETTDIFDQLDVIKTVVDHNSNKIDGDSVNNPNMMSCNKNLDSITCCAGGKYNTYPINQSDPKPKPKLRSNSDTEYLERVSTQIPFTNVEKQLQTDKEINDKFKTSIKSIETQTSNSCSPRIKDNFNVANSKGLVQCCTQTEEFNTNKNTRVTQGCKQATQKLNRETQKNLIENNEGIISDKMKSSHASPRTEAQTQSQLQNLCFTEASSNGSTKNNIQIIKQVGNDKIVNDKCGSCSNKEESNHNRKESTNLDCYENCTCSVDNKQTQKNKKRDTSCSDEQISSQQSSSDSKDGFSSDPIMMMIKEITNNYSKNDVEKGKKKRCYKEIMRVLRYLLDTGNGESKTDSSENCGCGTDLKHPPNQETSKDHACQSKKLVDVGVGSSSVKKSKMTQIVLESTDTFGSSEVPVTSDSATCKVLNKIKNECEKYHQKRCKHSHSTSRNFDNSSSTSLNCEKCYRTHQCACKGKCKGHRPKPSVEKVKKKCVAYNLIVQTSDSVVDECCRDNNKKLKNIVVKVPSNRKHLEKLPFKEVESRITKDFPRCGKNYRSRSLPNDSDMSSVDGRAKGTKLCTVRDYLEHNRPDFVDQSDKRQKCLKLLSKTRSNERAAQREMLSLQLERLSAVTSVSESELRRFAHELGADLRRTNVAPKFISEQAMKKHSQKIYKSLPEVLKKKEEVKKENIKKTNLLLANIFKKNLQRKTLRGSVNLSNYNTVIKI